jgi:hypothetical protein
MRKLLKIVLVVAGAMAVGCADDQKMRAGDVRPMDINPSSSTGKVHIKPPSLKINPSGSK